MRSSDAVGRRRPSSRVIAMRSSRGELRVSKPPLKAAFSWRRVRPPFRPFSTVRRHHTDGKSRRASRSIRDRRALPLRFLLGELLPACSRQRVHLHAAPAFGLAPLRRRARRGGSPLPESRRLDVEPFTGARHPRAGGALGPDWTLETPRGRLPLLADTPMQCAACW